MGGLDPGVAALKTDLSDALQRKVDHFCGSARPRLFSAVRFGNLYQEFPAKPVEFTSGIRRTRKPETCWRRGWDSNPRARFWQARRFRGAPVITTSVPLRKSVAVVIATMRLILRDSPGCFQVPVRLAFRRSRKNCRRMAEHSAWRIPLSNTT
jgi:hypothetical protein